jgi:hypothetical protein
MENDQNASTRGSNSSVIRSANSTSDESSEETYANGMVLSYLDSLMSGDLD